MGMLDSVIVDIRKEFDPKFNELVEKLDKIEKKVDDLLRKE